LLVLGDARCAINPVHGHGMSLAAMQAALLAQLLDKLPLADVTRGFDHPCADLLAGPWHFALASDVDLPGARGRRDAVTQIHAHRLSRAFHAASRDPDAAASLVAQTQLVAPQVKPVVREGADDLCRA